MRQQKPHNRRVHTIIMSDLHLGSPVSQATKALKALESYSFRKLILLGDIFESMDFRNLTKECWKFLNYVGEISKDRKVRWVIGNHDQGLSNIFGSLIDARIYESYAWQFKQQKYIAIHGHQFDRFLIDNAFLSYLASRIYVFIQKIEASDRKISRFLKRKSKGWLRLSEKVARGAMRYARINGANYVFCGHTHKAMQKHDKFVSYYNCGCWTDEPCTLITMDEKKIEIHQFKG